MAGQQLTVSMKYSKDYYRSDCTHSPELGDFTIASAIVVAKERSLHVCTVHKDSKCKDPIIVIKGDIKRIEKAPSVRYVQCAFVGYDEDKHGDKHGDKYGDKVGEKDGNKNGTATSKMIEEDMVRRGQCVPWRIRSWFWSLNGEMDCDALLLVLFIASKALLYCSTAGMWGG